MDRKTLLAIGLSLLFFVGWQKFYIEPRLPKAGQSVAPSGTEAVALSSPGGAPAAGLGTNGTAAQPVATKPIEVKSTDIVTGTGPAKIGDAGKFFTGWQLNDYRATREKTSQPVDLAGFSNLPGGEGELAFDAKEFAYANNVQGTMKATPGGAIWTYEDANLKLTREYSYAADKKYVDLVLTAEFKTKRPNFAFVSVGTKSATDGHDEADRQLVALQNNSIQRIHFKDIDETSKVKDLPGATSWIGAQSRYFLFALVPAENGARAVAQTIPHPDKEHEAKINLVYPVTGNAIRIPLKAYSARKR